MSFRYDWYTLILVKLAENNLTTTRAVRRLCLRHKKAVGYHIQMKFESAQAKFNRNPKRFGGIRYDDRASSMSIEPHAEETLPLHERYHHFGRLSSRIRNLSGSIDEVVMDERLEHHHTGLRVYPLSISFDERSEAPFLTLAAYFSANPEEPRQSLDPIGEHTSPTATESPIRLTAQWWPPIAQSFEWGTPRHPFVATGFNDFYRFDGIPISRESLDISQLHRPRSSSKMLTLIESSVLAAERQHAMNILPLIKDVDRFRVLDKVSPIIGTYSIKGRWAFSNGVDDGVTENLETPFRGVTFPLRGVYDNGLDEPAQLDRAAEVEQLSPILTVADIILSLTIVNKHELATRFATPLRVSDDLDYFKQYTSIEGLYTPGTAGVNTWLSRLDGSFNIFSDPVSSESYYNPKFKGLGLSLLRSLNPQAPHDPNGGMLVLPADQDW